MTGRPRHRCLEPLSGTAPESAYLSDRQRLGVVLQAAGLLSLLSQARWYLPQAWQGAAVDERGRMGGVVAQSGHPPVAPHRDLRRLILRLFGGGREVSGRGEARGAARRLAARWDQILFRRTPDRLVEEILTEAPWLWEPRHTMARRALIGFVDVDDAEPWVAGPGRFRSALLSRAAHGDDPVDVVSGPDGRQLWSGLAVADEVAEFQRRGHWREAALLWERRGAETPADRIAYARCLYANGAFERARKVVSGLRNPEARLVRAQCQWQLGELGALRRSLPRLEATRFSPEQLVELADVLSRALANFGDREAAAEWVRRALESSQGEDHLRALIVAAGASWDAGDTETMGRHLDASEAARHSPALSWRWHNARALYELRRGDGRAACRHLGRAIGASRRRLYTFQAGRLWNELGMARARTGDLVSAERAFLHASRLLARCDAVSGLTVAQLNLAEIRIRRGRIWGVREVLERAERTDRMTRNRRGSMQNAALAVRLELACGCLEEAVKRARRALRTTGSPSDSWHRSELQVLLARATGWLGRPDDAGVALKQCGAEAEAFLEPEELPALFALAGDFAAARDHVGEGPFAALWRDLLAGRPARRSAWADAEQVDAFRLARWVYDASRLAPGWVDAEHQEAAIGELRRMGAVPLADELARGSADPWGAIERFLGSHDVAFDRLFTQAGFPEARLVWSGQDGTHILVDGEGGSKELATPSMGGSLEVYAPHADERLRALLMVAAQRVTEDLTEPRRRDEPTPISGSIVGRAECLRQSVERADRLATRPIPILIRGETGTGKELLARRIHAISQRADGPFVAVDCAALAPTLLQSELFGFVRGAFSGAHVTRRGRFEAADGGTIFLDEIGDLPLDAQKVLLRVLQEGEVFRIGDPVPRPVDVRILAATHHDLRAMVRRGAFRRDLYFRLRVGRVELPPLAQRGDDVLLIARTILERESDGHPPRLSRSACARLKSHSWPGNVRELRNVLLQALALRRSSVIRAEDLEIDPGPVEPVGNYHQRVDALRRELISGALEAADGNKAAAARSLGITRQALSYLVRKLEL